MPSAAYVLCLETSTTCCSVSVASEAGCLALVECRQPQAHMRLLPLLCEQVLAHAELPKSKLTAIALSEGPGSFTGLRIGAAIAKGLCYGLGLPLIACPTLQVLAAVAAPGLSPSAYICPLLPQKGHTYAYALYTQDLRELSPPRMGRLEHEALLRYAAKSPLYLLGASPQSLQELRTISPQVDVQLLPLWPSAVGMAPYAMWALAKKRFVPLDNFVPRYPNGSWPIAVKP